MQSNILEGTWKQLRGKIQERWGKLTDDELDQAEGKADQLVGLLQEKYGYTEERARREVNSVIGELTK